VKSNITNVAYIEISMLLKRFMQHQLH